MNKLIYQHIYTICSWYIWFSASLVFFISIISSTTDYICWFFVIWVIYQRWCTSGIYSRTLFSSSFISTTSQLTSMPISAYLLMTLVYTSFLTIQILLAPYSTAISRQSTPGHRPGLYPSTQSSPSPCFFEKT